MDSARFFDWLFSWPAPKKVQTVQERAQAISEKRWLVTRVYSGSIGVHIILELRDSTGREKASIGIRPSHPDIDLFLRNPESIRKISFCVSDKVSCSRYQHEAISYLRVKEIERKPW